MVSSTVTVDVQDLLLPDPSVAVNVTVFAPMFEQSNEVLLSESVGVPQLSEDPLFTCDAVSDAVPLLLRYRVTFWQEAVGLMVSSTVTVEVQDLLLPDPSVAVNVTVFVPRFAQPKEVWLRDSVGVPQLSEEPLLTCEAVSVAAPELSR